MCAPTGYGRTGAVVIQLGLIGPLTKRFKDPQLIVGASALTAVMLVAWGLSPNIWTLLALMPFLSLGMAVTNSNERRGRVERRRKPRD